MVKIRLRRLGNKHRPFYRLVVAKSTAGRDGAFIEVIGSYNPISQPKQLKIEEDRALHWLMNGAQPTETAAVLLKKVGVLDKYFEARPKAKRDYAFLDKRTSAMSQESVVAAPVAVAEAPKAEEPVAEAPAEPVAAAEEAPAPAEEAPAAEEAAPEA